MKPLQPIKFPVLVKGEQLTASILEFRSKTELHLKFSNNYQNYFQLDQNRNWKTPGGQQLRGGDVYAKAVSDDLSAALCVKYWEKAYNILYDENDANSGNIWLFAKPAKNQYIYDVCFKGALLFQIVCENNAMTIDWYDLHPSNQNATVLEQKAKAFITSITDTFNKTNPKITAPLSNKPGSTLFAASS